MKQLLHFGASVFLSYIVLTIGVQGQTNQDSRDNAYRHIIGRRTNKTSIVTEFGEVFDCIDIYQQPAFDHPLMKNHVLQMKPSSYPKGFPFKSSSATNTTQAQLATIPCPGRTIPILRNNKVELLPPLAFTPDLNGEMAIVHTMDALYGARVELSIYQPQVKGNEDVSSSMMNLMNGQPGGNLEGIGAGSMVSQIFGDKYAKFHFYWVESRQKSCFDLQCAGFVQVGKVGLGQRITPVSTYGGKQIAITLLLFQDPRTKDWWLISDKASVGYWPSYLFTHLQRNANTASFGGYVYGPTISYDPPEMGSGHFAAEGNLKAAYARDIKIVDKGNMLALMDPAKTRAQSTKQACYTVDQYDHNSDGAHMYYGGPGGRRCRWYAPM